MKRKQIVLLLAVFVLAVAALGQDATSPASDDAVYTRPGQLVPAGDGARLNPPELNAKVLQITQTKAAMYDSYASEMEQMAWDEAYLQKHRRSLGSRPIRLLTSGNHGVGHLEEKPLDTPKHLKYEQETTLAQARWLELSSKTKQIFARHSSEYIQFDEPATVINAVREVYDQARTPMPVHGH